MFIEFPPCGGRRKEVGISGFPEQGKSLHQITLEFGNRLQRNRLPLTVTTIQTPALMIPDRALLFPTNVTFCRHFIYQGNI
jgi:hypothetical protein